MVVVVVGDVKAADVIADRRASTSAGSAAPRPAPLRTEEPPQVAERQVALRDRGAAVLRRGLSQAGREDPDDAVYDVLGECCREAGPRASIARSCVTSDRRQRAGFSGFPGDKYPNLFFFFAVPLPGHARRDAGRDPGGDRAAQDRGRQRQELQMVKTRAKADLVRRLGDNSGLAFELGISRRASATGGELFRHVDNIEKVSKQDVRRVAGAIYAPANRTVGVLESTQMATVKEGK